MADIPAPVMKEALRLLGADGELPCGFRAKAEELYAELLSSVTVRGSYARVKVSLCGDEISFDDFKVQSRSLAELLENSGSCVIMAVTLGAAVDRLISRVQMKDMADAVVLDALASAAAESECDRLEAKAAETLGDGEFMTMRFSPGYGDVPLLLSEYILSSLNSGRKLGISLTKSSMLVPIKSITAVIGISDIKEKRGKSCDLCSAFESCIYRKRGEICGA